VPSQTPKPTPSTRAPSHATIVTKYHGIGDWRTSSKVEILNPDLQAAMTHTSTVMPEIPERDPAFQVKSGH